MSLLRTFDDFLNVPITFYKTIGEQPYVPQKGHKWVSNLLTCILILGLLNFNLLVLGEMIYFTKALSSFQTVLEATAVAPCIGFSLVADIKEVALWANKSTMFDLLEELRQMFPNTIMEQKRYRLADYERPMRRVMALFSFLCLAYTSTFSIYPIVKSVVTYYLLGWEFEKNFGFFIWYPYDSTGNNFIYALTYLGQVHGAYLAGVAFLAADLLFCCSVTQLCMHFDCISKQLKDFTPKGTQEDCEFLKGLIPYHAKVLGLCESVNQIFSISILLNFMTSSSTLCFIGFQVTASSVEDIVKYCIFLLASLVQVMIICYYGNQLIEASTKVGDCAFYHPWYIGNIKYKKMINFIIIRSNKPSSIRPPTFPPISYNTFMKVVSMAYQFFALLRTTYGSK